MDRYLHIYCDTFYKSYFAAKSSFPVANTETGIWQGCQTHAGCLTAEQLQLKQQQLFFEKWRKMTALPVFCEGKSCNKSNPSSNTGFNKTLPTANSEAPSECLVFSVACCWLAYARWPWNTKQREGCVCAARTALVSVWLSWKNSLNHMWITAAA